MNSHSRYRRDHHAIGTARPAMLWIMASLFVLVTASTVIYFTATQPWSHGGGDRQLTVYCAAGIRPALDKLAQEYESKYGVEILFVPGNSGSLLGQIEIRQSGDLYIPADESFVEIGRKKGILEDSLPLAQFELCLAVAPGNPKSIERVADLLRDDVTFVIADPSAGVGKATKKVFEDLGLWDEIDEAKRTQKVTVNEVALDVQSGAVDAGLVWDSTAKQYGLEIIATDSLPRHVATISASLISQSGLPDEAMRFARFLASPEHGNPVFSQNHFVPIAGDSWEHTPELTLFSGTVSRPAIQETLREFEQHHGVRITTVYHGCGTLVGMMKTGQHPDAYLACDISYEPPAGLDFLEPTIVSTMDLVMLVRKGNPHGIHELSDLAKPGLRIGLADPKTTALGGVTRGLLEETGSYDQALDNLKTQNGGGDLLVSQMMGGKALDAVIVYRSNCNHIDETLEIIDIQHEKAIAVQPYWIRKGTAYPRLATALLSALRSSESVNRYKAAGFHVDMP